MLMLNKLLVLLHLFVGTVAVSPVCTFGYSPCEPSTIDGQCLESPGEQCYEDIDRFVFCCIRSPEESPINQTVASTVATTTTTTAMPPLPPIKPNMECKDLFPCCTREFCHLIAAVEVCPVTCGACTPETIKVSSECSDRRTDCWQKKNLCFHKSHKLFMMENCYFTCGYCSLCEDKSQCSVWVKNNFCRNPAHTVEHKRAYCPQSCGYCGRGSRQMSATIECSDRIESCPSWNTNGFCRNAFYSLHIRKKYCARSCGLC